MADKESWRKIREKELREAESKTPKTMGERLRLLRLRANKSLMEVHKDTGLSYMTLFRWETDKNIPDLCNAITMAEYYNATLDWLVLGRTICIPTTIE